MSTNACPPTALNDSYLHVSLNILKLYQAIYKLRREVAESHDRFCNVSFCKIILARGVEEPLEGDIHSAQYFHGRYGTDVKERLYGH